MHRYFILNKPFNMVSQFVSSHPVRLLGDIKFDFPEGTHAIGRLDSHSEGMLLLTTNKKITKLLFQSSKPHKRTYLVMVKRIVTPETLTQLRNGVTIRIKNSEEYKSVPESVEIIDDPQFFEPWFKPNPYSPTSWLRITLTEGKFHQVRKMVEAVHHRCIRLIRYSIEDLEIGNIAPGEIREVPEEEFFTLLKLEKSSIQL
jgi:23S rRNA pseudouridine2457 synthase